ncbi:DUF3800 domain-containing protein [Saccharopolyspora hirsuta]|uniref:DUF3800 domain-containing protein n=1 Tax=Saccharopolyspora hirsuta TaxID=1837 RepID=UPI003320EDC1
MADVFMYADETGNLDYQQHEGASRYFGIATAVIRDHGKALNEALLLRAELHARGVGLKKGFFHATDDSHPTRKEVFSLIAEQGWRLDATMLDKHKAYDRVRKAGEVYLYKMAWYLHFKYVAPIVAAKGDRLFVVAATLGTNARKKAFESALHDVCQVQGPHGRDVHLCHWPAPTSWGLQVADYAAWAVQRKMEKGKEQYWSMIVDSLQTCFEPWAK